MVEPKTDGIPAWLLNAEWLLSPDTDDVRTDLTIYLWLARWTEAYLDHTKDLDPSRRGPVITRTRALFYRWCNWTELAHVGPCARQIQHAVKRLDGLSR